MVLDTKQRRDFLAKATAIAEGADPETKTQVACLVTQAGKTDQPEYILTSKIYVIGKDKSASVRLKGWFLPSVAAIMKSRLVSVTACPPEPAIQSPSGTQSPVSSACEEWPPTPGHPHRG